MFYDSNRGVRHIDTIEPLSLLGGVSGVVISLMPLGYGRISETAPPPEITPVESAFPHKGEYVVIVFIPASGSGLPVWRETVTREAEFLDYNGKSKLMSEFHMLTHVLISLSQSIVKVLR